MVIGIDTRVLTRGTRTGVEEYTLNLLNHLFKINDQIEFRLFHNAFQKSHLNFNYPNVKVYDFKIPNRLFFLTAKYFNQPKIDKLLQGVDVYFNPHFFVTPLSLNCRRVVTFHDLSFKHWPDFFSFRKRLWQFFLMAAKKEAQKADRIIAISESTKQDLINLYKIEPTKIKVIYSGISSNFKKIEDEQKLKRIQDKYKLPNKFILYFGTIEPRKNIIGLIKAFESLKADPQLAHHDYRLVIAGTKGWLYNDIFKTAKTSLYRRDIFFTDFIEEEDKPGLYSLADLFVYPSFFEGFGFPPLEAMACQVPTIVSNVSSLPEVVGKAAITINPYNIDEIFWAMKTVLIDQKLRQKMIEEGQAQVAKFSWQKCASQTLDLILGK